MEKSEFERVCALLLEVADQIDRRDALRDRRMSGSGDGSLVSGSMRSVVQSYLKKVKGEEKTPCE
jgi:hypothetical protein